MTREEKIESYKNASNEELLEMYDSSLRAYDRGPAYDSENKENLILAKAEIMRRLEGTK